MVILGESDCFRCTESRDFVNARDIASAIVRVAERAPCRGEVYNVASGSEIRITDLVDVIRRKLAPDASVAFDGILPAGVPGRWRADLSRISSLGWRPTVALGQGIADYVRWYRQLEPNLCYTSA